MLRQAYASLPLLLCSGPVVLFMPYVLSRAPLRLDLAMHACVWEGWLLGALHRLLP